MNNLDSLVAETQSTLKNKVWLHIQETGTSLVPSFAGLAFWRCKGLYKGLNRRTWADVLFLWHRKFCHLSLVALTLTGIAINQIDISKATPVGVLIEDEDFSISGMFSYDNVVNAECIATTLGGAHPSGSSWSCDFRFMMIISQGCIHGN